MLAPGSVNPPAGPHDHRPTRRRSGPLNTAPGSHRLVWLVFDPPTSWILGVVPANPGWPRPRHNTLLLLRARLPDPLPDVIRGGWVVGLGKPAETQQPRGRGLPQGWTPNPPFCRHFRPPQNPSGSTAARPSDIACDDRPAVAAMVSAPALDEAPATYALDWRGDHRCWLALPFLR